MFRHSRVPEQPASQHAQHARLAHLVWEQLEPDVPLVGVDDGAPRQLHCRGQSVGKSRDSLSGVSGLGRSANGAWAEIETATRAAACTGGWPASRWWQDIDLRAEGPAAATLLSSAAAASSPTGRSLNTSLQASGGGAQSAEGTIARRAGSIASTHAGTLQCAARQRMPQLPGTSGWPFLPPTVHPPCPRCIL